MYEPVDEATRQRRGPEELIAHVTGWTAKAIAFGPYDFERPYQLPGFDQVWDSAAFLLRITLSGAVLVQLNPDLTTLWQLSPTVTVRVIDGRMLVPV